MSIQTTNYGLIKPQATDPIDLLMTNPNWDTIDEKLKEASESGGTHVVVQPEEPADTSVLWIDTNDDSNTMDIDGAIEAHNAAVNAHTDMRELIALKGNKTEIVIDATSGNKSLSLSASNSNTEWRYVYASGITSLALSTIEALANTVEAYYSVVFISGTTATTITNTFNAYFSGDDCVEGIFTPAASKTYDLGIWWNGVKWQAAVRGSV